VSGSGDYLERILPVVVKRLEERRARTPVEALKSVGAAEPRPSFARALSVEGIALIAEIKRASPSKGNIRPNLEVAELVADYEAAGAQAVSVLTEQDFFLGSLGDLRRARAHTCLPLLLKDFVVDEYQLYEARAYGASAVLLIAALLDGRLLGELAARASDLGLDVLLEVHDETDLERALPVEGAILGINNRDLRTFQVSLETTERLASLVPAGRLLVSESGIRTHADVERLATAGVDAVLVGESLLIDGDTQAAIRGLMGG
jgi:indole-3-glycerol phosphate synthase